MIRDVDSGGQTVVVDLTEKTCNSTMSYREGFGCNVVMVVRSLTFSSLIGLVAENVYWSPATIVSHIGISSCKGGRGRDHLSPPLFLSLSLSPPTHDILIKYTYQSR